jgi:hypothetical protein
MKSFARQLTIRAMLALVALWSVICAIVPQTMEIHGSEVVVYSMILWTIPCVMAIGVASKVKMCVACAVVHITLLFTFFFLQLCGFQFGEQALSALEWPLAWCRGSLEDWTLAWVNVLLYVLEAIGFASLCRTREPIG